MRSVETEGGSIDEAIGSALATLRVTRDEVEIEILENAARGLFGLGSRKARVRATIRPSLQSSQVAGNEPENRRVVSRETASRDAVAARAKQVLEVILGHLVDAPRVEEVMDGDSHTTIQLDLRGEDSGIVIGRRGQTLDALEHLVSRIALRDDADPSLRLVLDVEGYRQRRQESLEQMARRLAHKARVTARPIALNPMSPRDRRIIHLTIDPEPGVTTTSEGEGHYRRVVILPGDAPTRGGDKPPSR
jgi:spoIIIJ-associated protein